MSKSNTYRPLVGVDCRGRNPHPIDFAEAHKHGLPHRGVHVAVVDGDDRVLTFQRKDGRREILGGHCDWLPEGRAESWEESAVREVTEELNLRQNWPVSANDIANRLRPNLTPLLRTVNSQQSSHGNNLEVIVAYELAWDLHAWGNPEVFTISEEHDLPPIWLTWNQLVCLASDTGQAINSAMRLFFHRSGMIR